ncbi:MAG: DUF5107 domain-containing protein [Cyclobacteriaceae bacterium]|nr:DUF5107 domain-containing protein [Cyclobacteriaceae bacterium]
MYNSNRGAKQYVFTLLLCFFIVDGLLAQNATITESKVSYPTYTYSDPNPIPILTTNPKIFPYHKFDGYSHEAVQQDWKTVILENEFIKVVVLPEVGGKVWAGIEKSTGQEFLYANDAIKFRNIAMRGPWTSGGIEFNFGIIGHSPSTASPVDYTLRENDDGSVSCIVGNFDLPSRTTWQVNITLPKDKAFFETKTTWYNHTPLGQSYYNWMTGAAAATEDLEFFYPGNQYLTHPGEARPWPRDDQGRVLSMYKNNDFGPAKSYHVVGSFEEHFGGYYHNSNFGFGHWAPYDDMPGAKLWIWSLSRSGGIWEDLLTDHKGQYIEFQAGRMLNQYSPGQHVNPIVNTQLSPYSSDRWREIWFPYKEIGGMVDAAPQGVLNVERNGSNIYVGINALQAVRDTLRIFAGEEEVRMRPVWLKTMETYELSIDYLTNKEIKVVLGNNVLYYSQDSTEKHIAKSFAPDMTPTEGEKLYINAQDAMAFREYEKARINFERLINLWQYRPESFLGLAKISYRKGFYQQTVAYANNVLSMNTYHPEANFLAGLGYHADNDLINALEAYGWAARSPAFRSAAYTQMAIIKAQQGEYVRALHYTERALDYDRFNVKAQNIRLVALRKTGQVREYAELISTILNETPLNHFARYELAVRGRSGKGTEEKDYNEFLRGITNEFPNETILEVGIDYLKIGETGEAIGLLSGTNNHVKSLLWNAWSHKDTDPEKSHEMVVKVLGLPAEFVFFYRQESLRILEWANKQNDHWKLKYYLALNYLAVGREKDGLTLLEACENKPNYATFYLTRAALVKGNDSHTLDDLIKAITLEPDSWRAQLALYSFYQTRQDHHKALAVISEAYKSFSDNHAIGFNYAQSLLENGNALQCVEVLNTLKVLPFEGYNGSREVYEESHLLLAFDYIRQGKLKSAVSLLEDALVWPETLGVGMPYDPDHRKIEYLLAYCKKKLNQAVEVKILLDSISLYTVKFYDRNPVNNLVALLALKANGQTTESVEALLSMSKDNQQLEALDSFNKGKLIFKDLDKESREYEIMSKLMQLKF